MKNQFMLNQRPDKKPIHAKSESDNSNKPNRNDRNLRNSGNKNHHNKNFSNRKDDNFNKDNRRKYKEPDFEFDGIIESEGVLDIMQDGYGFLKIFRLPLSFFP